MEIFEINVFFLEHTRAKTSVYLLIDLLTRFRTAILAYYTTVKARLTLINAPTNNCRVCNYVYI